MMTSCLLIVMWQVKKEKENFNLNIQTQKKIEEKKISKKNLSATFQIFSKCHYPIFSMLNFLTFYSWLTNGRTD